MTPNSADNKLTHSTQPTVFNPLIGLPGAPTLSQAIRTAYLEDMSAGRIPFTAGSLSDMQAGREGYPTAGVYTAAELAAEAPVLPITYVPPGTAPYTPVQQASQSPVTQSPPPLLLTPQISPSFVQTVNVRQAQNSLDQSVLHTQTTQGAANMLLLLPELSPEGKQAVSNLYKRVQAHLLPIEGGGGGGGGCDPWDIGCILYGGPTIWVPPPIPLQPSNPPPVEGSGGSTSTTPGIDDIINISNNITNDVSGSITQALEASIQGSAQLATQISGQITADINSSVLNLGQFVTSAFGTLGGTISGLLQGLGQVLANVFSAIFSGLKSAVEGIGSVLKAGYDAIGQHIENLVSAIKANGALAILPVLQLIVTAIVDVKGVLALMEGDIHNGIAALILLPIQLASMFTTLDQTITLAAGRLNFVDGASLDTDVSAVPGSSIDTFFTAFTSLTQEVSKTAAYATLSQDLSLLTSGCVSPRMQKILDDLNAVGTNEYAWVKQLSDWFYTALIWLAQSFGELKQIDKLGEEEANKYCQLEKLDPVTAAQALRRGLIDGATYDDQLLKQGWSQQLRTLFHNLTYREFDPEQLVEYFYRSNGNWEQIVPQLVTLGFTADEINFLQFNSGTLASIQELLRWKDFHLIDEATFTSRMEQIRRANDDIQNILATYQARESTGLQIGLEGRRASANNGYPGLSVTQDPPQDVFDAAERDQMTADNARSQWLAHWQYPSWTTILQSDFRQLAGLSGILGAILNGDISALADPTLGFNRTKAQMVAENIPPEFQADLIQLARPLIPFRSIPTFVQNGIMSKEQATVELLGHGFDPQRILWILDYATRPSKTKAATATQGIAGLATGTAHTLFLDGAITQDQYVSVLVAHGIPQDVASLQASAQAMALHAKERKQTITDMVNEVYAGYATIDDAIATLNQQGFTQAEIAKFQKEVRSLLRSTAKHPSIADMKTWIKAGYMSLDAYKNELQAQGWSDPWVGLFIAMETPAPQPATGGNII